MRTALLLTALTGLSLAFAPAAEAKSPIRFNSHTGVIQIGNVGIRLNGGDFVYPGYYPPAPIYNHYRHHEAFPVPHPYWAPQYVVLVQECIHMPWQEVARFTCRHRAACLAEAYLARGFRARVIQD